MQRVHAINRCTLPSTSARTFCRFGNVRFLVLLLAWLTLLPMRGRFPQRSHFQAMTANSLKTLHLCGRETKGGEPTRKTLNCQPPVAWRLDTPRFERVRLLEQLSH